MLFVTRLAVTTAAVSLFSSAPSFSADNWDISGKASAGLEQQSNVNISQLEQASGRSDVATLLAADLNATWQVNPKWTLSSGYSVQDKNYREADDFNTRLHLANIDAGYQHGNTTYGTNYYYAMAELAGERFLTLNQGSVYAMHSASDSWFVRPAITATEKTFANIGARDANNLSISTDSFWFFAEGQHFVSLGLVYEDEDTQDNSFSYRAPGLRLKVSGRFDFWHLKQQLQLGMKISKRDYQKLDTDTAPRQDTHSQLEAKWQLNVTPVFSVVTAVEHGDFSSTLESADYRETRSSVSLQVSF
ncbi:surface lipoprotein assembly modifier [Rheinheimera sp. UJ63]|uniref:surface lipoprotein assembly modifier n=1 Tax=Rheinheimera sp. UJ63 TaxID=2910157 RepID=UPI001F3C2A6B|nr:surface lipoprotein assembly modifier [Rheinheimera sp. UJ63]MCF4010769.1 surface lipoprotein assembly modifier [Rheinheimera sp. UJ63]